MNDKDAIWNAFITEQPIPPKPAKLKTGQPPTPPVPTKPVVTTTAPVPQPEAQPDPGIQPAQPGQYGWNTPKTHKPPTPTPAPGLLPSPEEAHLDDVVSGKPAGMSDAEFRRQYTRVDPGEPISGQSGYKKPGFFKKFFGGKPHDPTKLGGTSTNKTPYESPAQRKARWATMTPAEVDAEYAATVSANKAATAKANRNTPTAPTEPEHLYRRKTTADEFVPIGGAPTDAPYESPAQRKTREAAEQEAIQAQVRKDQTQGYKRPDGTMVPPSVVTVDTVKQAAANATPPKSALERPANPMSAPNPASTQPAQDVLTQQDYLGDPAMQQHIQSGGAPIDQDLVQRARMQSDYEPAQPGVQKPGEVPNYMKPGGVPNHMQHLYDPANPEPPGYVSQQDYLGDPAMQQHIQSGGAPPSKASPQFDMPTDWKKYWNDIKNASEA